MQTRAPVRRHVPLPANWARGYGEELAREVSAEVPECTAEYDPRRHAV